MLSTSELLINLDDIRNYPEIAANVHIDAVMAKILEAQRLDIIAVLGAKFYHLIWNNPATYTAVIDGVVFDGVQYYGLKPLIVYCAVYRFVQNADVKVTATGARIKSSDQSERAPKVDLQGLLSDYAGKISFYKESLKEYLCKNRALYPEYTGCGSNIEQPAKDIQVFSGYGRYGRVKW